jgi:NAD(P)-dependent dehydrogenase (short-subunit alcohol dehydrogenase family)
MAPSRWDVGRLEPVSRNVVVSGGGTGMGRAIARASAAAGDPVAIMGRRPDVLKSAAERLRAETGTAGAAVPADLSRPDDVERAAAVVASELGDSGDVNNAGGVREAPPGAAGLTAAAGALRANLDANVMTAVLLMEALLPRLSSGVRGACWPPCPASISNVTSPPSMSVPPSSSGVRSGPWKRQEHPSWPGLSRAAVRGELIVPDRGHAGHHRRPVATSAA